MNTQYSQEKQNGPLHDAGGPFWVNRKDIRAQPALLSRMASSEFKLRAEISAFAKMLTVAQMG